mmetsp:Transcript_47789/g.42867  ORF Transcript_47789/g.42867 Transcript_47789/m.42867 type:complete len:525 (+) Transcript_47789:195-1769(+)
MDNWVDKEARFEAPIGYKWSTQAQYLDEYYKRRDILSKYKEWIHFGLGDWDNYRWKYARKIAFIFKDTFKGQRFVHSGMEVCDINHVKSIYGLMAESPLMEYDDQKGIVEGFAGLVLLSDQIWFDTDDDDEKQQQQQQPSTIKQEDVVAVVNKDKDNDIANADSFSLLSSNASSQRMQLKDSKIKSEKKLNAKDKIAQKSIAKSIAVSNGKPNSNHLDIPILEDDGTTSSWTSEEDDEQIQNLLRNGNYIDHDGHNNNNGKDGKINNDDDDDNNKIKNKDKASAQALHPIHHKTILSAASVPYPNLPPPQLANTFAEYTQKHRAALTKKNLEQHTKIEHMKHIQHQQHQQLVVIPQQQQQQQQQQTHPSPIPSSTLPPTNMSPKSLSRNAKHFKPGSPHQPQFNIHHFQSHPHPTFHHQHHHHSHHSPHHSPPQQPYLVNGLPVITPQLHTSHSHQYIPTQTVNTTTHQFQPQTTTTRRTHQLPIVPAPQLTQRLSVNSLPVPTTNNNDHHHHHHHHRRTSKHK